MDNKTNEMAKINPAALDTATQPTYGFEETRPEDVVIPRIKVINAMSPERLDGIAVEGQLLNSLTSEDVTGKVFIPVKQYYSNIRWNPDRNADPRIQCRSFDGRIGQDESGTLACETCRKNQFDNTKQGKEAQPTCTAYLNFLGFFEGEPMPVILSFAKTNYNEGKKLLSIAKSMRASIWNYGYVIESKKITKDKNVWYNIVPRMSGTTGEFDRTLAFQLFKTYESIAIKAEYEESVAHEEAIDTETASEI